MMPARLMRFSDAAGGDFRLRKCVYAHTAEGNLAAIHQVEDFAEEIHQQRFVILAIRDDPEFPARGDFLRVGPDREESICGILEQLRQRPAEGAEPNVGGMFEHFEDHVVYRSDDSCKVTVNCTT